MEPSDWDIEPQVVGAYRWLPMHSPQTSDPIASGLVQVAFQKQKRQVATLQGSGSRRITKSGPMMFVPVTPATYRAQCVTDAVLMKHWEVADD